MSFRTSRTALMMMTMVVAMLFPITANVLRNQCEEKAITAIIRSGGRVYYGFQDPQLSVRKRPNSANVSTTEGVARIRSYQDPVSPQASLAVALSDNSFAVNGLGVVEQATTLVSTNSNSDSPDTAKSRDEQPYFEVLPLKDCRVHMGERIITDLLRRIECASVSGLNLDKNTFAALANLRRLRQLIVYDSNPKQRDQLAKVLPNVEIIWR